MKKKVLFSFLILFPLITYSQSFSISPKFVLMPWNDGSLGVELDFGYKLKDTDLLSSIGYKAQYFPTFPDELIVGGNFTTSAFILRLQYYFYQNLISNAFYFGADGAYYFGQSVSANSKSVSIKGNRVYDMKFLNPLGFNLILGTDFALDSPVSFNIEIVYSYYRSNITAKISDFDDDPNDEIYNGNISIRTVYMTFGLNIRL